MVRIVVAMMGLGFMLTQAQAVEITGMAMIRPDTCAGSTSATSTSASRARPA